MKDNVQDFMYHEIESIHKNIDRMQHHLEKDSNPKIYSGQRAMLAIQREHLSLIEALQARVDTYEQLIGFCQNNIMENEALHSKIAYLGNPIHSQPSADWWRTLHLIEFWSDFLSRIHLWQQHHTD